MSFVKKISTSLHSEIGDDTKRELPIKEENDDIISVRKADLSVGGALTPNQFRDRAGQEKCSKMGDSSRFRNRASE